MKNSTLVPLLLALAILLTAGCTRTSYWARTLPEDTTLDSLKTRDQILKTFGGPENVAYNENGQAMVYLRTSGKGGGIGIGSPGAMLFSLEREHTCSDTLIFILDLEGNVRQHILLAGSEILNGSIWPFDTAE